MPLIEISGQDRTPSAADLTVQDNTGGRDSLISVVVATFNAAATLDRCIDSVAGQTYQQKELIIIDGGSHDGTVEVLRANTAKIAYWFRILAEASIMLGTKS